MKLCLPNLKQFGGPDSEIYRFEYEAKKYEASKPRMVRLSSYRMCARQCSKPARRDVARDVTSCCDVTASDHPAASPLCYISEKLNLHSKLNVFFKNEKIFIILSLNDM